MRKILIFILVVFCGLSVQSQSFPGDVTIAPQIGASFSTYFTSKRGFDPRITPGGGIIGEYYFNRSFSFRSGFLYDQLGARDNAQYMQKLDYLSVPINAAWHFGRDRSWYMNIGPTVSILLSGMAENEAGDVIDLTDAEGPVYKEYDFGPSVGIGYKFHLDYNTQIFLDYQGYASFLNIAEGYPFQLRNFRNSFNFGVIFTFDTMKGLRR